MIEAIDRCKDVCVKCGKEIIYDKEDGYWDSFEKEENHVKYYSPLCDINGNQWHEPTNYVANKLGYYYEMDRNTKSS